MLRTRKETPWVDSLLILLPPHPAYVCIFPSSCLAIPLVVKIFPVKQRFWLVNMRQRGAGEEFKRK
jgi:hypothetical protein